MREVVLASVRTYARRYVAAAVAVLVGVGFVVATDALASSTRSGLVADVERAYTGAEYVVTGFTDLDTADRALEEARGSGVSAAMSAVVRADVGEAGTAAMREAAVATQSTEPQLRSLELASGRFATGPGEAVVDEHAAKANAVRIGDQVVVRQGGTSVRAEVTGLVEAGALGRGGVVYLTWPDLAGLGGGLLHAELLVAGESAEEVATAVADDLPEEVVATTADEHVRELQTQLMNGVDVVQLMVLVFAAIALFVAVMVIANTFAVLLAQRMQEFALLRCVGVTRRQLLRSVRAEALTVSAVAATVGVLAGALLGRGLVAVARELAPTVPLGPVEHSWLWMAGAWLVGVLMTLAASTWPARRSTRMPPVAALRAEPPTSVRSRAGALRVAAGVCLLVLGAGTLAVAMELHQLPVMIVGGSVTFLGVLVLGPVLVPAVIRGLGLVTRRSVTGSLAAANAVRNPRRTAATAASLLVGVTLISAMVVGTATARATVTEGLDQQYPIDAMLTSVDGVGRAALADVRDVEGVAAVEPVEGTLATLVGPDTRLDEMVVLAPGTGARSVVRGEPELLEVQADEVLVSPDVFEDTALEPGGTVTVRVGGSERRLRATPADGVEDSALVAPAVLRSLGGGGTEPLTLWVRTVDGADADDVSGALSATAQAHGLALDGGLSNRAFVTLQLDVMLAAAVALLAISVVIAVIGVASTLGLSVLERTREHALMRAIGLSRRQLRRTLTVEAVLLAGVAGAIGVLLGVAFAWVGVHTMIGGVVPDVALVLPVAQLAGIVAVAAVAGLAAGVLPARRAARITPAAGLAAD